MLKPGMCPASLQNPSGKEIPVSIFGPYPYMASTTENGVITGAAIDLLEVYARKFNFIPKTTKAQSFDGKGGKVEMESINHKNTSSLCSNNMISSLQVHTKESEIGIGFTVVTLFRYKFIEYLPWMNFYNFEVQSKKPEPIVSYDALIYPFDKYTWYLTTLSTLLVFLVLIIIQKSWGHASGKRLPIGWVFQGDIKLSFYIYIIELKTFLRCYTRYYSGY